VLPVRQELDFLKCIYMNFQLQRVKLVAPCFYFDVLAICLRKLRQKVCRYLSPHNTIATVQSLKRLATSRPTALSLSAVTGIFLYATSLHQRLVHLALG
jgi:hypothetical protein